MGTRARRRRKRGQDFLPRLRHRRRRLRRDHGEPQDSLGAGGSGDRRAAAGSVRAMTNVAGIFSCYLFGMDPSAAVRSELAPTGKLRVGINYGNFLLVTRHADGAYTGIAVDLGRELGRRLGVPVDLVAFATAGKLADAVKAGAWDVAFLGNEPQRAGDIAFSPAYLEIEAGYLVPAGSPIKTMDEVDRKGIRIAIAVNSAYDLYLSRSLKHATRVPVQGIQSSYDIFVKDK